MATKSLAELKAAFGQQNNSTENTGFWNKFYPFFKMDIDQKAIVRFLPDQDENNTMAFLVENLYHKLTVNGREKTVACLKMFDEPCPCCELSRKYYGNKDEKMGLKFWHKRDYIGQVLVLESPFDYEIKEDENPVRLISLGPKIFKLIREAFASGDLDNIPCDFTNGYDFRIVKSKQGQWADYSMSRFLAKSTPIPEHLLGKVELYDLKQWRYKKIEREQMDAMIEADMTGAAMEADAEESVAGTPTPPIETVVNTPKAGVVASAAPPTAPSGAPAAAAPSAADILKRIRERNAAKG